MSGRAVPVALLLLALGLAYLGMWRGWKARASRQADLPTLPAVVEAPSVLPSGPVEGWYVGTSAAGPGTAWLDRVVVHGLGRRSTAVVDVTSAGVRIDRDHEDTVFIPAARLRDVRRDRAVAGKVSFERDGLLVLSWQLGERRLDTGLRLPRSQDAELVRARSLALRDAATTPQDRPLHENGT